jgi:hypothetical protein
MLTTGIGLDSVVDWIEAQHPRTTSALLADAEAASRVCAVQNMRKNKGLLKLRSESDHTRSALLHAP